MQGSPCKKGKEIWVLVEQGGRICSVVSFCVPASMCACAATTCAHVHGVRVTLCCAPPSWPTSLPITPTRLPTCLPCLLSPPPGSERPYLRDSPCMGGPTEFPSSCVSPRIPALPSPLPPIPPIPSLSISLAPFSPTGQQVPLPARLPTHGEIYKCPRLLHIAPNPCPAYLPHHPFPPYLPCPSSKAASTHPYLRDSPCPPRPPLSLAGHAWGTPPGSQAPRLVCQGHYVHRVWEWVSLDCRRCLL